MVPFLEIAIHAFFQVFSTDIGPLQGQERNAPGWRRELGAVKYAESTGPNADFRRLSCEDGGIGRLGGTVTVRSCMWHPCAQDGWMGCWSSWGPVFAWPFLVCMPSPPCLRLVRCWRAQREPAPAGIGNWAP